MYIDKLCSAWLAIDKTECNKEVQSYHSFRDNIAIIDDVIVKGRRRIILEALQRRALIQLCAKDMG